MRPEYIQRPFDVRLEWGPPAAEALRDVACAVVVDVLSFTTAVTVAVEGARCQVRRIVLQAGGEQGIEHRRMRGTQFLGTAGDHQGLLAVTDRFIGVTDTLAAGCAGKSVFAAICRD